MTHRFVMAMLCLAGGLALGGCATRGSLDIDCPGFASQLQTLEPSPLRRAIQAELEREGGSSGEEAPIAPPRDIDYLRAKLEQARGFDETPGAPPSALLILSGGGQWGSFGASFLTLQPREGTDPAEYLPDYQVVTGVSTGGLQALFLAVGDAAAQDALRKAYAPASESEIVDRDSFLLIPIKGSQAGLGPLKTRAEQTLCSDAEMASGNPQCLLTRLRDAPRVALIGFVEARSGDFKFVDVRDFFANRSLAEARSCIVGAALASAAMPVFFQQVRVDGTTYFDGGVRLSLFIDRLDRALSALQPAAAAGEAANAAPIYLVRNGPTDVVRDDNADKAARDPVSSALRAEAILVNQTELNSIEAMRLADISRPIYFASADRYRGFTDVSGTPRKCEKKDAKAIFDPQFMGCLADLGKARASREGRWRALPTLR